MRSARHRFSSLLLLVVPALAGLSACAPGESSRPDQARTTPMAEYCSNVQSPANPVTVSGKALYQYRVDGNGKVADGIHTLTISGVGSVLNTSYELSVNGTSVQWACDQANCASNYAATKLAAAISASVATVTATASSSTITLKAKLEGDPVTTSIVTTSRIAESANEDPRPIRRAEVRVTSASGALVQCGHTDASGNFSVTLPGDGAAYTVSIAARAYNGYNTAYIMNNPTENAFHKISTSVNASGNTSNLRLVAKATDTLEAGAFNILDQILNAQEYLRAQTAGCGTPYPGNCTPFTVAPIVYVYWTAGLSPGVYAGISGGISYYLNGRRELYILGGVNGDTTSSDMDHFDNSVIIHEYAHFLEDQYGSPNSPGGSHNGNSIIDPRLAWGEGWANFFQAAVTGSAFYRDTYGTEGCVQTGSRPCKGNNFLESLDSSAATMDEPTATGEGNFREFSVARALYAGIKNDTPSTFSEIWAVISGTSSGMRVVNDQFKSISRFHRIQVNLTNSTKWATVRSGEMQRYEFTDFATPFVTTSGCSPSSVTMNILRSASDDGSFAASNLMRNNDFYVYNHPGGAVTLQLAWTADGPADLDLYLYKAGYVFGNSSSIAAYDQTESTGSSGSAGFSVNAPAGAYMINVMAFTGLYNGTASYTATYQLRLNGQIICPTP